MTMDLDKFSQWRPAGTSSPRIQDDEEDLDRFSNFRPVPEKVEERKKERYKEENPTFSEGAPDYTKQFAKGTLIGAGGLYGDLAQLAGIRPKDIPGQEERSSAEYDVLTRMKDPDYKPSFFDLELLSGDSEGVGAYNLPTSQSLEEFSDLSGASGEPENIAGRFGKRQGRLYGSGLAFGQFNPLPSLIAGGVGQLVEEKGGSPAQQLVAEIAAFLLTPTKSSGQLGAKASQEVKDKINQLRKLGYTDEDITLALNAQSKGKNLGVKAFKGERTEKAFEDAIERSNDLVSDILSSEIPGIDKGIKEVHQIASDAYGQVAKQAQNLTITNSKPFVDSTKKVVDQLQNTLGTNPEAQAFIKRLSEAAMESYNYPSAERMMNFYKELNSMGNWLGRSQKDRLISEVKEGIKDTFRSEGAAGKKLATDFEEVNAAIRRAYQADDLNTLIQKATTQDGIDFKKMNKIFDKPENVKLFEDVLGKTQTNNVRQITKTAKEIKDFDKSWKAASLVPQTGKSFATQAAYFIYTQNWPMLATLKGAEYLARKLAEKSLTDPKFQNLLIRGLYAVKGNSPRTLNAAMEQMQKYLQDEGSDINLKTEDK